MNGARVSRLGHRWLALVIGAQLLLWTASGLFMTAVDIDFIHGDSLVRDVASTLPSGVPLASIETLRAGRDDIVALRLRTLPDDGQRVYELERIGRRELVDAATGRTLAPLSPSRVRALARAYYAGHGQVARVRMLGADEDIPAEIRGRRAPLWRVDFDDWLETTFYLHPDTGSLVTRRHRLWRWYDFLWSLHIMDYREREHVDNVLLRVVAPLALTTVAFGGWLAFFSFAFLRRRRPRTPS